MADRQGDFLAWDYLVSFLALTVLTHCKLEKTAVPIRPVAPADLRANDSDTVAWQGERVCLVGFDTPEILSPRCAAELHKGQAARRMVSGMIAGAKSAGLVLRPERDRYGRTLAVFVLNGADVGPRLVAAGLARPYHAGRRSSWCGA